jgi:DNA polymerase-1
MLLPDSGTFVDVDFSQLQLRILAQMSEDPIMLGIFEQDGDIHQDMANELFECDAPSHLRRITKNVNFSIIFGATLQTVMDTAGISDSHKAAEIMNLWMSKFKRAAEWIRDTQQYGLNHGITRTMYGRELRVDREADEGSIMRKAVNYAIQGTEAEIVKRAMLKCAHLPMALEIHDELLFDGDVVDEVLACDLEHVSSKIRTPISIKVLERWE